MSLKCWSCGKPATHTVKCPYCLADRPGSIQPGNDSDAWFGTIPTLLAKLCFLYLIAVVVWVFIKAIFGAL
jgi:hypothetical protein